LNISCMKGWLGAGKKMEAIWFRKYNEKAAKHE
jgi:hypothetical protein